VIAQSGGSCAPLRISVKGRRWPSTGIAFRIDANADWDWPAAVAINAAEKSIRCWMLPREVALHMSKPMRVDGERRLDIRTTLFKRCEAWEDNFAIDANKKRR
jgi:hypothetical protein